ncbi:hypothetical protein AWZ03_015045, partial [Drosophila navojoa]
SLRSIAGDEGSGIKDARIRYYNLEFEDYVPESLSDTDEEKPEPEPNPE